jgi:EAL domain-containing protein (putative c-di-GMP-specific phosphodiesterase class I)
MLEISYLECVKKIEITKQSSNNVSQFFKDQLVESKSEILLQQRLELIGELSERLVSGGRFSDHLGFILERVCNVMDVDACVIRELVDGMLQLVATHGIPRDECVNAIPADIGLGKEQIQTREPVTITRASDDPITSNLHSDAIQTPHFFKFISFAGAPMIAHGKVIGVIGVFTTEKVVNFDKGQLNLLQIIANTVGVALEADNLMSKISSADVELRMKIMHLLNNPQMNETLITNEVSGSKTSLAAFEHQLEYELRNSARSLTVYFQPFQSPADESIKGYEALARWQHPRFGMLHANQFISLAEKCGLIRTIGEYIYERALSAYRSLSERFDNESTLLCLNASVYQLDDTNFAERLIKLTEQFTINPQNIILELTERVTLKRSTEALNTINKLSKLGFQIYIDDFGAGFSSLSHLISLPVSGFKIDKMFLPKSNDDERKKQMMRMIVAMARNLNLKVIVEGVEHQFQKEFVSKLNVDFIQGFYICPPKPLDELITTK